MLGTEAPVQEKVVADLAAIGWAPMARAEMTELRVGRMGEPTVEPLLMDGLRQLNAGLSEQQAIQVVERLRRIPDSESFLLAVRDGVDVAFSAEEAAQHITVVDWREPARNSYVVTSEFELKTGAMREPRLDVVCLVNGIPLGIVETKGWTHDWKEAARDLRNYWLDAPELEKYCAVCVASNGWRFRIAPSGTGRSRDYSEWKDTWPHELRADSSHRELEVGLLGTLDPHTLADLAANFVVFEKSAGGTKKKLARYQQFRAANKLVRRVLDGVYDRGLIWHTQGSGKSLTMLFAARKLVNIGLENPTVFVVIDRVNLDDQINRTFEAASFEGVTRALSRAYLRRLLAGDRRGVIVTTLQKFDETMSKLADRENVIVLIDEAHRGHLGKSVKGIQMRDALPQAKLFAFTGTPIEIDDRSSRQAFSPEIDGVYENYLDLYTYSQANADGATVQVLYQYRGDEWGFEESEVDASFDALADAEDLDEDEREKLKADAARLSVIAKAPERMQAIAEDVVGYVRNKLDPAGFKAQLVAVDRAGCALYAEALIAAGFAPEEIAVVFTPNVKKDDPALRHWYAAGQLKRLCAQPVETGEELELDEDSPLTLDEALARKALIANFEDPEHPLKVLIVTDMLLTGFDAPIEQVMFLDKPLKGAKLLQAVMRTNRPYPKKDHGIIVDYWGVFRRLQEAFAEFDPEDVRLAVIDMHTLQKSFPIRLAEALALVAGLPKGVEYEQMMWLVKHFGEDPAAAEQFEERFDAVEAAFETLAPDAFLAPHLADYQRLVRLRALWRHGARLDEGDGDFDLSDYRPQTHALVQDAVSTVKLRDDLPVYAIDGRYVDRVKAGPGSPEEKAAEVEAAIEFEIRERGEDDPIAWALSERLEQLRRRREEDEVDMLSLLDEAFEIASSWAAEKEALEALGLSERAQGFLTLIKTASPGLDPERALALTRDTDAVVGKHAGFEGWSERDDVLRDIRLDLIRLLAGAEDTQALLTTDRDFVDELVTVAASRERS